MEEKRKRGRPKGSGRKIGVEEVRAEVWSKKRKPVGDSVLAAEGTKGPDGKALPLLVPLSRGVDVSAFKNQSVRKAVSISLLSPQDYPALPPGQRRKLYVRSVDPLLTAALSDKGYDLIDIITLPRTTIQDQVSYLLARMQGAEEGTLLVSDQEYKALVLQLRAFGILDKRAEVVMVNKADQSESQSKQDRLDAALDWQKSRHTLRGNSTVQGIDYDDLRSRLSGRSPSIRPVSASTPTGEEPTSDSPPLFDPNTFDQKLQ